MIKVDVINNQSFIRIKKEKVIKIVKKTLSMHRIKKASLNLVLVNNRDIRTLNRRFLSRDQATDVLCFSYLPVPRARQAGKKGGTHEPDAEIIVSCQMACQQARLRRISPHEELYRYIIHGILHYLGYKDNTPNARSQMFNLQEEILRSFEKQLG